MLYVLGIKYLNNLYFNLSYYESNEFSLFFVIFSLLCYFIFRKLSSIFEISMTLINMWYSYATTLLNR